MLKQITKYTAITLIAFTISISYLSAEEKSPAPEPSNIERPEAVDDINKLPEKDVKEEVKTEKKDVVEESIPDDNINPVEEPVSKIETDENETDKDETNRMLLDPEENNREKLKVDNNKSEKNNNSLKTVYDIISDNGIYLGYGSFSPLADYGERYDSTGLLSFGIELYKIQYWGFSPDIYFQHLNMSSSPTTESAGSTMTLTRVLPGIIYRYNMKLPSLISKYSFFKGKKLTLYGRVSDGITRVSYESSSETGTVQVTELINTFALSAGFMFSVYGNFDLGFDLSYSYVFTAGVPLEGVSAVLMGGLRL